MRFKEYGTDKKDTIILLHGGGLSWWNYRETAEILKNEYHTPYLLLGALASFTGIAILIIMIFSYRRRNKQG